MDRITNIETDGNIVSGVFLTNDISEVNMLRRAILSELDTYAIDIVVFNINTSARHDEIVALRLGQLVIDNTRFVPPQEGDFRTTIDVSGPKIFTTDDIPNLPFKFKTPIMALKAGQRIMCDVIVKKGQGKIHVKWRPVSRLNFTEVSGGYKITMKEIGMLTGEEIFRRGLEKMKAASERQPINLFSHPLIPVNI